MKFGDDPFAMTQKPSSFSIPPESISFSVLFLEGIEREKAFRTLLESLQSSLEKKLIQLFHNNGIGDKGRRTYGNQN